MMKREYVKPMFYAEEYVVADSIAACGHSQNDPITMVYGETACVHGDGGHKWDGNGTLKGYNGFAITLFNDGTEGTACEYDWGGPSNNVVTGPDGKVYGTYSGAFFGNESTAGIHAPGYQGQSFFS